MNEAEITVTIVSKSAPELRGFSGLDEIYIHSTYFQSKFETSYTNAKEEDCARVEIPAKMSLIALSIHEFGHVRLRQVRQTSL